ncbi:MAG TPA: ThuA domain-containing protein [Verrucomicrobiae bacterium]|nr:ThuA domain-containing protein [Verrucomicrobiae bacterium]
MNLSDKKSFWPGMMGVALTLAMLVWLPLCHGQGVEAHKPAKVARLLVVTVTKGYRHASIAAGESVVAELAQKSGAFSVDFVRTDEEMAQKMTPAALRNYDGVFFLNTTGILPLPDKQAFLDWIKSGKGFIGTHSATDTFHGEHGVDPYIDMIGGEFVGHTVAQVNCIVVDPNHPATRHFGKVFPIFDEIYMFKNFSPDKVHLLLKLDKQPGTDRPGNFPISWCKSHGAGRVFYTALGHEDAVWANPDFQLHLLGGIKWALGLEQEKSGGAE